jgi:hypothetical protein
MAYPTISAPYGFKPINRYDGMPYAGATRQLPLTTGTAIYFGQPVELVIGGTVSAATSLTANAKLGVFVGCQYTNSSGQTVQAQYYPGTGVTNAIAYVVDDPVAVFKVAVTDAGGAIATVTQAAVGTNVTALVNTPSANTGDAATSILSTSPAVTATFPFRIIDVVKDTAVTATTFCEVIVKINLHQYNTALGNAVA